MRKIVIVILAVFLLCASAGAFDDGIWYCSDINHPQCNEIVFDVP